MHSDSSLNETGASGARIFANSYTSRECWQSPPAYAPWYFVLAGAAEIPATRLFGRSPQGLNATGESDLKNYYERIAQLQETYLRPALERLLPVLEISAFGYYAPDSEIVFEPIATATPSERADILSCFSASLVSLYQAGLLSRNAALRELRAMGKNIGMFANPDSTDPGDSLSSSVLPDPPAMP